MALGDPSAPKYGGVHNSILAALTQQGGGTPPPGAVPQGPDPSGADAAEDGQLQKLVADAHTLAAELTRYAIAERQEPDMAGPSGPPAAGPGGPPPTPGA